MTRLLVSTLLAVVLLPFATAPAGADPTDRPASRATAQVRVLETVSPFSPNGDGRRDRAAVRYRLSDGARVSVEVRHGGRTVYRTTPRAVRAGTRTFVWAATRTSGRRVPDGAYRVVVRAAAGGITHSDSTRVVVDTKPARPHTGTLRLSSDTVYPYASVVDDVVVGNVHLPAKDWGDPTWAANLREIKASRAQVLDDEGVVVATVRVTPTDPRVTNYVDLPTDCGPCGRLTWDGRDSDGVRQPVGTYRIRVVRGRDAAGNVRVLAGPRKVTVSRDQLVEKTTTLDLLAVDAPRTAAPSSGCVGCELSVCDPGSSTRFPGGLTFDLGRSECSGFRGLFTTPVDGRRTPYDWFALSATGGPSTEDGSASAVLTVGAWPGAVETYPMSGDTTTVGNAIEMTPNSEVYPADWPQPVVWEVEPSTGSYDLASFAVEVHTYVPATTTLSR